MRLGALTIGRQRPGRCHSCGHGKPLHWRLHVPNDDDYWRWVLFAGPLVVTCWQQGAYAEWRAKAVLWRVQS